MDLGEAIGQPERAGHSDPQTTMSVYTHVNLDAERQAVDILAGALSS